MNVTAIVNDTIARFRGMFTVRRPGLRQIARTDRRLARSPGDIEHIFRLAQGAGSSSPAGSSASTTAPAIGSAPVGHRQPRANDVPSNAEKNYTESAEDKALDRKIKSICRGC